MKKNEQFIITINRELGSGGRTVGEKLAEKLGVDYYDKALIKALMSKYHLGVKEIETLKGRNHSWWAEFKRTISLGSKASQSQYFKPAVGDEPDLLTTDEIFKDEQEILKGIAEAESCIIAGRSGFYVFRNHPNRLSVLIQAPLEQRIQRVMTKQNMTYDEAKSTIAKIDKMRENYIQKYTKSSRYDTRNYDIVLSMQGLTEEAACNIILEYINSQQ